MDEITPSRAAEMTAADIESRDIPFRHMICFGHVHLLTAHVAGMRGTLFGAVCDREPIAGVMAQLAHMRGALDRIEAQMLALAVLRGEDPHAPAQARPVKPEPPQPVIERFAFASAEIEGSVLAATAERALARACMAAFGAEFRSVPRAEQSRSKRAPRHQVGVDVALPPHTQHLRLREALRLECAAAGIELLS
jgi:hypothetical protein